MGRRVFFVCGTDTEVGKTFVSCTLLRCGRQRGLGVYALKPLASGGNFHPEHQRLENEDALALAEASSVKLLYEQVNPVCLEAAVAPHLAAKQAGRVLRLNALLGQVRGALSVPADLVLIEGAGGWKTPLDLVARTGLNHLAQALGFPVLVVVGLRLGCINHALLTIEAIQADGLAVAGWVANVLDADMPLLNENIASLRSLIQAPCLGVVGRDDRSGSGLDLSLLGF